MNSETILTNAPSHPPAQSLPWPAGRPLEDAHAPSPTDCSRWFSCQRLWGKLPPEAIGAMAPRIQCLKVAANTLIYQEGQTPIGLYLLKGGSVEIFRQSPLGRSFIRARRDGDTFGYTLVADQDVYQTNAIALTDAEIGFLPQTALESLVLEYPQIQQVINVLLAQDLHDYTARIAWEEVRIQGLRPYIQSVPAENGVLGSSKAAQKLAHQIQQAASTLDPVLFQAQMGTGKTFLAGLIHKQSTLAGHPFVEMDCAELPRTADGRLNTDALFGRVNQQPGILELLERGTLLLDNVQVLGEGDCARLTHYLKSGAVLPNHGIVAPHQLVIEPPRPVQSWVRLILASPQKLEFPGVEAIPIKLFTLIQRQADIAGFAKVFLDRFCREQNRLPLRLDQSELRRLLSYSYPGNLAELAEILHRAVIMAPPGQATIPEQALWSVESTQNAFRLDLLTHVPWLRQFLLGRWYPEGLWVLMMAVFVPITVLGFVGPQTRGESLTLNLFWAWWWPGYLFLFAFVGRLWCAVCPFMITAEWLRRLSLWLWPRQQLPWNTQWLNRWGAWVMFGGFLGIYLWEQLWDLPHHAILSAWLLLAITAGAVVFSLIYERRLWCRYLCPIGGMNGMFAKLSMVELRSTQQVCGSQCQTFGCYRGSSETPITFAAALPTEGQAVDGCPLYSHPAQLQDNRDCMLCMTCLKGCPNRSAQLNLRFPASDLLDNHRAFWAEAALLLLLFGGVFMHHGAKILGWLGVQAPPLDADHLRTSLPMALALLSIPAGLIWVGYAIARLLDPDHPSYLRVVYAYLPFALAANLAHFVPAAITEAGQLFPLLAQSLGYAGPALPALTWSLDVAQFLQGVTLLSALAFSPYPLLRITQPPTPLPLGQALLRNSPHLLLLLGLTLLLFQLMM